MYVKYVMRGKCVKVSVGVDYITIKCKNKAGNAGSSVSVSVGVVSLPQVSLCNALRLHRRHVESFYNA